MPQVAGIYARIADALNNCLGFLATADEVADAADQAELDGIVIQTYANPTIAARFLLDCGYLEA